MPKFGGLSKVIFTLHYGGKVLEEKGFLMRLANAVFNVFRALFGVG